MKPGGSHTDMKAEWLAHVVNEWGSASLAGWIYDLDGRDPTHDEVAASHFRRSFDHYLSERAP